MTDIVYAPAALCVRVQGHAGAGEKGKDIVCAAASMLSGTLAAALHNYGIEAVTSMQDGDVLIRAKPQLRQMQTCRTIFETVLSGAELLAAKEPEHVRVTIL